MPAFMHGAVTSCLAKSIFRADLGRVLQSSLQTSFSYRVSEVARGRLDARLHAGFLAPA